MAVQCLTDNEKQDLYDDWMIDRTPKAQLARDYGISTRTVTRVLDEVEESEEQIEEDSISEISINWWGEAFDDDDDEHHFFDEDDELYDILEEPEETEYHFIATPNSLTITKVVDGDYFGQVNADHDHPRFQKASTIVWGDQGSQSALEEAFELLDQKAFLEKKSFGKITVDPEQNRVYYTDAGYEVDFNGRLVPRLIESLNKTSSADLDSLVAFTTNLSYNPSNRAVNELYDFLEASDIKINEDGMVVCFKKVRCNYTDIHSGKFDNSPGAINEVPRNMVDEDSDKTCSYGLHVCSKSYLPYFGWAPDCRVMKVIVDPSDFVAIPKDYNFAKARVCCYEVVEDITDTYEDDLNEMIFA